MVRPLIPEVEATTLLDTRGYRRATVTRPLRGADPDDQSKATTDFLHVDHIEKASRLPVF